MAGGARSAAQNPETKIKSNLVPLVVIATKGRQKIVGDLVEHLALQTLKPAKIIIVGTSESDLPEAATSCLPDEVIAVISPRMGASVQRNVGLDRLRIDGQLSRSDHFVVFFDDDFVPAKDWLERAAQHFSTDGDLAGITGWVLADGVNGQSIDLTQAKKYISGELVPTPHWSNVSAPKHVESLYGCNMAFPAGVASKCSFDEELPLYSWQEDCDYSGQARRMGRTMLVPDCRGVHLGVKGSRTSGVRMGYSQIANPIRIARRGNMPKLRACRFVMKALAANLIKSIRRDHLADYNGRLRGNAIALYDIIKFRLDTKKIVNL